MSAATVRNLRPAKPTAAQARSAAAVQAAANRTPTNVIDAGPGKLKQTLMDVTPDLARQWLDADDKARAESGKKNRPRNNTRIKSEASKMQTPNAWKLTHQGVAFAGELGKSELTDGQHRIAAVVEADCTVQMLVSWNMPHFDVIDVGMSRGHGQILAMAGYTNATSLASAIRFAYPYYNSLHRPWFGERNTLTAVDICNLAAEWDEQVQPLIGPGKQIKKRISWAPDRVRGARAGLSPSAVTAGLFICSRYAARTGVTPKFEEWMDGFVTGAIPDSSDARLAFARWVTGAGLTLNGAVFSDITMLSVVRCWDAYRKGKGLRNLSIQDPATYMYRLPGDHPSGLVKADLEVEESPGVEES
jgi:hypothetical protein